jgi:hypothetical protein
LLVITQCAPAGRKPRTDIPCVEVQPFQSFIDPVEVLWS